MSPICVLYNSVYFVYFIYLFIFLSFLSPFVSCVYSPVAVFNKISSEREREKEREREREREREKRETESHQLDKLRNGAKEQAFQVTVHFNYG